MRSMRLGGGLAVVCLGLAPALWGAEGGERLVFPLAEAPAFNEANFGTTCVCGATAESDVVYPAFASGQPLYGQVWVDNEWDRIGSGTRYPFAVDESGGTGSGYDRLYLDLNHNGRLSDDTPLTPLSTLPSGMLFAAKSVAPPVWFQRVTFASTDEAGTHSLEVMPRLLIDKTGLNTVSFTTTTIRQGEIAIAGQRFRVKLLNANPLGTRWDRPWTTMKLETKAPSGGRYTWLGSDRLIAVREMAGSWWQFATTPGGNQLIVSPYRGAFGTVRTGRAGWSLSRMTMTGSLLAKDKAVGIGYTDSGAEAPVPSYEVPVGDYAVGMLSLQCGSLRFSLSDNYFAQMGGPRQDLPPAYPWKIRKDGVFPIQFSRKPQVVFASPAPGARLKPGDVLQIAPMLVDPKLNVLVRDLRRQTRIEASIPVLALILLGILGPLVASACIGWSRPRWRHLAWLSVVGLVVLIGYLAGVFALNALLHPQRHGLLAYDQLTPQATIARADGTKVAGGPMPFG